METELSVRDVLTKEYVGVSESDTVLGAVELMREERVGCVLVVRGSEPVGIMTEWDVLGVVVDEARPGETTVGDVMSTPVLTIEADRSLTDAADTMARDNIRNLVVESRGEVVGVLTQRDVIAATGSFQAAGSANVGGEPEFDRNPVNTTASTAPGSTPADDRTASPDADGDAVPNGGDEYSQQGVCEACGSLAESLWDANGQLVCSDCRSV